MFDILKRMKEYIIAHGFSMISSSILTVLGGFLYFQFQFFSRMAEQLSPKVLAILISSLIMGLLVSITFWLYLLFKNRNKLELHYDIYWDKELNRYCPGCKKPGMKYHDVPQDPSAFFDPHFFCHNCNKERYMYDEIGQIMPLRAVLKLLKKSS